MGVLCPSPLTLGHGKKQKSAKYILNVEEAYVAWHFSIILISLRVEVALITDFLVHVKSCRFEELFST